MLYTGVKHQSLKIKSRDSYMPFNGRLNKLFVCLLLISGLQRGAASAKYVKGYAIHFNKIKDVIGATDIGDWRISQAEYKIMEQVNREVHWLVAGQRVGESDGQCFSVITFGEQSFGEDLELLRKKEIPVPDYLRDMEIALEGPDVYKFYSW
jgi:hypothetical protein